MPYFMGLDISTTSAKALIIDEQGNVQGVGSTAQPISQPQSLWSEQNPADWLGRRRQVNPCRTG